MNNPLINPSEDYKLYLFYKEKCADEIFRAKHYTNIKRANDYRQNNLEKCKSYQRQYNRDNKKMEFCKVCNRDINILHMGRHCLTYKHTRNQQILDGEFNISSGELTDL